MAFYKDTRHRREEVLVESDKGVANGVASLDGSAKVPAAQLPATVVADGGVTTAKLADDAVTNPKLANMAEGTIKGRQAATGTGDPEDLTATQARTALGLATGDSPQFTGVNLGHASDTTLTRTGAGDVAVEGNALYRAGGTDVPVADGGTGASDAATARTNLGVPAAAALFGAHLVAGLYYAGPAANAGTTSPANGVCRWGPFLVAKAGTVDRIGVEITVSGSAGALLRLGIYSDDGSGRPGARVLDAGTIDGTQAAASYDITVSQALTPGLYWLACAWQGGPTTGATIRTVSTPSVVVAFSSPPANQFSTGYTASAVTGALPDPAPAVSPNNAPARVYVRAA